MLACMFGAETMTEFPDPYDTSKQSSICELKKLVCDSENTRAKYVKMCGKFISVNNDDVYVGTNAVVLPPPPGYYHGHCVSSNYIYL